LAGLGKSTQAACDTLENSLANWDPNNDTHYLYSIPGMIESILDADKESLSEGTRLEDINWD
jgi:hypothetical protein